MVSVECQMTLSDFDLVERVKAGETGLYEVLMRRYNQRLFRTIRSVILDDQEAEDVLQDAWVRAFEHLGQFEADPASLPGSPRLVSTKRWLEREDAKS